MADTAALETLRVPAIEVVRTELLVGAFGTEQMVADFEDVAADGDDGFAVAAMREDAAIACAERRRLRACGGVAGLDETGA